MLRRLAFLLEPCQHTPKRSEYDQIKIWFSVLKKKGCGRKATEERKAKAIIAIIQTFLENSRCLLLWNSHTNFPPLFNRFSIFDKNVNLSKTNPEAKRIFFLVFPSLNTSIFFYDVSKNSEHINTFRGAPTQKSPS